MAIRVDLVDANGQPVPRHVMHHLIMVNFSRRQLLYSAAERLMGAGTETDDEISVPKTIGVPMTPGMQLGMYVAWHNDTGKDLEGVYPQADHAVDAQEPESAAGQLAADLHGREPDGGRQQHVRRRRRASRPRRTSSPCRSAGGCSASAGTCTTTASACGWRTRRPARCITRVVATRDSAGQVIKVSRKLYGVSGDGLKLKANHKYRVVGEYDNPTGETQVKGAMAHMVGLFVPDDMSKWPAIDPRDPTYQRDLASLQVRGTRAGRHEGNAPRRRARGTRRYADGQAYHERGPARRAHGDGRSAGLPPPPADAFGAPDQLPTIRRTPTHR